MYVKVDVCTKPINAVFTLLTSLPITCLFEKVKGKEQSFFSNNFIVLNHIQICGTT